jgi:hypothetical protein
MGKDDIMTCNNMALLALLALPESDYLTAFLFWILVIICMYVYWSIVMKE